MSQAGNFFTNSGGGGSITSVDTDNGVATPVGGVINIITDNANINAGSSVLFSGTSNTVLLNVTDINDNSILGQFSGNLTITGTSNAIFGSFSGGTLTSGSSNTVCGASSLRALTEGQFNTVMGRNAGNSLITGNNNVFLGALAGNVYDTNESNNISIGYNVNGVTGESNTLRIGVETGSGDGEIAQTFISGIDGINVGSVATVVTENNNQLGTAVITAGAGITITPTANTITISSTDTVAFITTVSSTINDVTGDSTPYNVVYDNVIADTHGAYNNTTGVFTAPVTGYYQLNASVCAQGLTSTQDYEIRIDSNDAGQELEGSYLTAGLVTASVSYYNASVSGIMYLNAGNEVFVTFISSGGAKVVDVFNAYSWFNGAKIG